MSITDMKNRTSRRNQGKADPKKDSSKRSKKTVQKKSVARRSNHSSSWSEKISAAKNIFVKLFLVIGVASVVGVSIYFGKNFIDDASSRPINTMSIQGDFKYLTQKQVSELVLPMIDNGFLTLPLSGIKELLEQNPWIDTASVSRRWPDKLAVSVVEQYPIARWGKEGFLNLRGEFIEFPVDDYLLNLPVLSGNAGQEKLIMQDYQQLAQLLRTFGLKISEFYCDELMSRRVVLDNGLVVNMGRDRLMEKIQRFLTVYNASLKTQLNDIATIDLRYGNGVAVEWRSKEDAIQQQLIEALTAEEKMIKQNKKA